MKIFSLQHTPDVKCDVSVLVVNYNAEHLLDQFFGALLDSCGTYRAEVIVYDNGSVDGSVKKIKSDFPFVTLLAHANNIGFGRANNGAFEYATGRYVLLLNTDAFVEPDSLSKTIEYMDVHPNCGILGVKLIGRDGTLQPSCRYFPTPWNNFLFRTGLNQIFRQTRLVDDMSWDHASVRQCDWVPGCYYLIRREVIEQVGLFDPRYFLYYEEVDHCFATRKAGWEVHYFPGAEVVHLGGESAKSEGELTPSGRQIESLQMESELLYFRKNHGRFAVFLNVLLVSVGDGIIVLKRMIKNNKPYGLKDYMNHTILMWKLYVRTRFGLVSTR